MFRQPRSTVYIINKPVDYIHQNMYNMNVYSYIEHINTKENNYEKHFKRISKKHKP